MKMKILPVMLSALLVATPVAAEEEVGMVGTKRLKMTTSLKIAQAAVAECTTKGIQIGVTVVDREGIVQVVLRDDIAAPITVPISERKAYTAANFNSATSALVDRANGPIGRAPKILMSAGGLPVHVGGQLVGAVGVSGAPSGETDEQCAKAGIDAVLDDLEMAM